MASENTPQDSSLDDRVLNWLSTEGYPFEFHCAREASEAGLKSQLGYHTVSSDGVSRELDVFAGIEPITVERPGPAQISIAANLFVECKYAGKKPWIVLCQHSSVNLFETLLCVRLTSIASTMLVADFVAGKVSWATHGWITGARFPAVGFSVVEAFRSENRDVPFAAIEKVADAAQNYVTVIADAIAKKFQKFRFVAMALCYPCVAIDGPLFAASLDPTTGEMKLSRVSRAIVMWQREPRGMVWLVTKDDFRALIGELTESMKQFQSFAKGAAESGKVDAQIWTH